MSISSSDTRDHNARLRKAFVDVHNMFVKQVKHNVLAIMDELYSKRIINEEELDKLSSAKGSSQKRCRKLLKILRSRTHPQAYIALYDALKHNGCFDYIITEWNKHLSNTGVQPEDALEDGRTLFHDDDDQPPMKKHKADSSEVQPPTDIPSSSNSVSVEATGDNSLPASACSASEPALDSSDVQRPICNASNSTSASSDATRKTSSLVTSTINWHMGYGMSDGSDVEDDDRWDECPSEEGGDDDYNDNHYDETVNRYTGSGSDEDEGDDRFNGFSSGDDNDDNDELFGAYNYSDYGDEDDEEDEEDDEEEF